MSTSPLIQPTPVAGDYIMPSYGPTSICLSSSRTEWSFSRSTSDFGHWRYWGKHLRSIPPCVWNRVRQGYWIGAFFVALGVYIGAGVLEAAADAALSGLLTPESPLHTVLNLAFGLTTIAAGRRSSGQANLYIAV